MTVLKVVGGVLAFLGLAWRSGAQDRQDSRQGKREELDELSPAHCGTSFAELDGSEERGAILALYDELHDQEAMV